MRAFFGYRFLLIAIYAYQGLAGPLDAADTKSGPTHIVVFDAGSSGTRVHVFNLYKRKDHGPLPVVDVSVRSKQTLKVKPGLSSFAEKLDLDGTKNGMLELLDFANRFVPRSKRRSTPLLLKATAGLRAVKASSAEAVLDTVRAVFRESEYQFIGPWVEIIPGFEEGGLSWVAANYLKGTFNPKKDPSSKASTHDSESDSGSVGVLELGGGSLQVTLQVDAARQLPIEDTFNFQIPQGRSYHVYAHSYLGFGQDYAQNAVMKKYGDVAKPGAAPPAPNNDPCYPKGYERRWSAAACEASGSSGGCADASSKIVKGTGESKKCYEMVSKFLKEGGPKAPGQYFVPPVRGQFIAIENFWYVRNDLKLPFDASPDARAKAVEKACEENTASVNLDKPKKPKSCFALSYQNALFDALKARKSDGADIEIIHELNGADVDWALGAAIVHYIKKQNTVIVSDDAVKSYNSFLPAYITTTAEIGGMIITMATLYVCVCRGLLFGQGKGLNGRPAHGIGLGVLGSNSGNKLV